MARSAEGNVMDVVLLKELWNTPLVGALARLARCAISPVRLATQPKESICANVTERLAAAAVKGVALWRLIYSMHKQ
jgi:hypothetical protein